MPSVALGLFLALAAVIPVARADLPDAVNSARLVACRAPLHVPLRDDAKLRQAAQRMAEGASLHAALTSSGYLAAESSAVHLTGAVSDAQIARALAEHYCTPLRDSRFTDMGALRHGREAWIVLAAPITTPSAADASRVSRQILELVNQARRSGRRCGGKAFAGVPPLTLNATLTRAALAHSQDMAAHGVFDHTGGDGSSPAMRVVRAGYTQYWVVGENIAAGAMTPTEVTQGWLESPAHCENIMDPRFSEIGIAFAVNRASSEIVYWTQDFAMPRRPGSAAPSPAPHGSP
jgi:uncharacterized protein YkwD